MIDGQNNLISIEEFFPAAQTEIESGKNSKQFEASEEVIFIRRQFQSPSMLEVRFARLKKAMRNRSANIL